MSKSKYTVSRIERLKQRMLNPPFGLGKMHYTSFDECEVVKIFNSLPKSFRAMYRLEIPRQAHEFSEAGTRTKVICVGRYYVINKR